MDIKLKSKQQNLVKQLFEQAYKIEVEVLNGGKLPTKAHPTDAGFDVFSTDDIVLRPGEIIKHPLNIRMKLPKGPWARIETKSGLGSKGMLVYAGVIDEEYRGVPHVVMTNMNWLEIEIDEAGNKSHKPIRIKKGEKLAQITMNPHANQFYIEQVESVDTDTARSSGGFGSTGA